MVAFQNEREIVEYLTGRSERDARRRRGKAEASPAPAAAAPEPAKSAAADESVTNVQHAGVDEGGIVKLHGDHLVVLRRGRLFTVNLGDDALTPISSIDAFGPDVEPAGAWYDEMLVSKNTVVVIGYSYRRGGTEIGLFDIDAAGKLAYRATYHLRSNDYYSSRNYASRLLGEKLVFYTPLHLWWSDRGDPLARFPALRRWHKSASDGEFKRIAAPTRVYRAPFEPETLALHTVTVCDLSKRDFECEATAVMGPPGRVFYVSPRAVYVWMTEWHAEVSERRSLAYRLPLDGGAPGAVRVSGSPIDQFSFLESDDQHLNVFVRADAAGEGMWGSEVTAGDVALMRVPVASFDAGATRVPSSRYARLPKPSGYTLQNRFVGSWLLYGTGSGWGRPTPGSGNLHAYRFAGGEDAVTLELGHGIDRIEQLGQHAIVVGTSGQDLHFSPVSLAERPHLLQRYTRANAAQGELRSHGFFYKPNGPETGVLGLPIRGGAAPGHAQLRQGSAAITFLNNDRLRLSELGDLRSGDVTPNDGCRASCVDWYGNARPLFLKGRVFALLGYEIVEGVIDDGKIRERRRTSFAPSTALVAR